MSDENQTPEHIERSLATDALIVAAPTIAVVADHLLDALKQPPPPPPPPESQIVLPPGVERD